MLKIYLCITILQSISPHHKYKKAMATVTRVAGDATINPVIQLIKQVINKEDTRSILQIDFRRMESLLQGIAFFFRYEQDVPFFFGYEQKEPLEIVKIWLQLLQNSLMEANGLLDRREGSCQSCLDSVMYNPRRLSKKIREWKACFNHIHQGIQTDIFQHIVLSGNVMNSRVVAPFTELLKDVMNKEQDNPQIPQAELRCMESLLQDMTTLFRDEPDIATLFQRQKHELLHIMRTWIQLLQSSLKDLHPATVLSQEIRERSASFHKMYHGLQSDLSRFVTSVQFVSSKPFYSYKEDALHRDVAALASVGEAQPLSKDEAGTLFRKVAFKGVEAAPASLRRVAQPLSKDEAWTLFRTVAFKGVQTVSMDIQERARNIAEECRSDLPLAIKVVAAAMIGKTSVQEWDNCLSSIQTVDPSFHHPGRLDAQLYAQLRYSYDALPNSHVKRCFLYCAMYPKGEEIDTDTLLQMWIGEGLVNSQQASYLMDMAIGRKCLKLLVDRFFFQRVRVSQSRDVFEGSRTISVHNFIHDMAVYIAQKEENCVFVASQNQLNFPEVDSENCSRISVAENFNMEDLPTGFRCPKLASLTLQGNPHLKKLPSELLLSVTCLRVLNLSGCSQITSVPTSIGQLRMLEFLSLSGLPRIKDFPEQICNLSSLQFLDLSSCTDLTSLPSQIGQLRNLKHLNLKECKSLKMIPREMCELTSLSRLQLSDNTSLSVQLKPQANIWSLKGLKSLTELQITIDTLQQDGEKSRIKDGIMGTWSEMRHLALTYNLTHGIRGDSYEEDLLPEDMQNMKKLQSFMLYRYVGLSLPNCMFEHLEMVKLFDCDGINELSPLERLPNLKLLKLHWCYGLRGLGIGSPSGYVSLQKLVLKRLDNLERLGGGASERVVWDERTLPQLRVLKIVRCESLKRFPKGMENLPNLCALIYQPYFRRDKSAKEWWESLMWEDNNMKVKLGRIFIPREPVRRD